MTNLWLPRTEYEPGERPFLFFAIETPVYPWTMFGGILMWRSYGVPAGIPGCAVLVGSGILTGEVGEDGREIVKVTEWLISELTLLAERVTAEVVGPDDRVIVFDGGYGHNERADLRQASEGEDGLRVFRVSDKPWGSGILYTGAGRSLRGLPWVHGAHPVSDNCLISSPAAESPLERAILDAAPNGHGVHKALLEFWWSLQRDPSTVARELAGYSLFATLGSTDSGSLIINLPHPDASRVRRTITEVAVDLQIPLYDAGSISDFLESARLWPEPDRFGHQSGIPLEWPSAVSR